jgi:2-polyprenyl-6-methoxyphenol hydroxylase-like FAD-dependent oxidoreductase
MSGLKVLISGASIAGPALALWLHRSGADVTVVEIAPRLRTGGQLVDVRGVGRDVLKRMGIDQRVRAAAEANYGFSLVNNRYRRNGGCAPTILVGMGRWPRSKSCAESCPG